MKNICLDCKHCGTIISPDGEKHEICRAHPPTVHFVMDFNQLSNSFDHKVLNLFPSIPPDGLGCGEFVRKE